MAVVLIVTDVDLLLNHIIFWNYLKFEKKKKMDFQFFFLLLFIRV